MIQGFWKSNISPFKIPHQRNLYTT